MNILVVDCDHWRRADCVDCAKLAFPDATIRDFADPLLALKYGVNNPVDLLLLQSELRIRPLSGSIVRTLRRCHPRIKIALMSAAGEYPDGEAEILADKLLTWPVIPETLLSLWPEKLAASQ